VDLVPREAELLPHLGRDELSAEHADRRGDRPRLRDDLVRRHRDEVAAGAREVAHADDDRLPRLLRETVSRQIVSEATYDPPGLSTRKITAWTSSSSRAARSAAETVSDPIADPESGLKPPGAALDRAHPVHERDLLSSRVGPPRASR
jgi:hypothetical protein